MDLLALVDFNLVATHGGFGKASRASGKPKATLSRHVMELEESLGVRLLERGARSLRLTEQGAALFARSDSLLGELADLGESIGSGLERPRGLLRVSVPLLFAHIAIGPIAARFAAANPDVRLEIVAEDRFVDLVDEGFDVVVRTNPRPDDNLVGRCIIHDHLVVAAAPSLPRPAPGSDPVAVPAVMLIASPQPAQWVVEGRVLLPDPVMRLSSMMMVCHAAMAGAGAAMLPRSLVDADIAAGRLVSWGRGAGKDVEVWVLHTSRRLASSKVSAFVRFLVDEFASKSLLDYQGRTDA
jgi:DNA-binding transcriptional LysR family regulator